MPLVYQIGVVSLVLRGLHKPPKLPLKRHNEKGGIAALFFFRYIFVSGIKALATDPADAYEDSRANPFVRR